MKQHIFYYSTALERGLISILELSRSVGTLEVSPQKKGNKNNNSPGFQHPRVFFLGFHRFHRFPEVGSMSFSISPGSTADFRPTSIPGGLPSAVPRRRAALGAAGRRRWIPRRCGVDVGGSLGVAGGSAKT